MLPRGSFIAESGASRASVVRFAHGLVLRANMQSAKKYNTLEATVVESPGCCSEAHLLQLRRLASKLLD